MLFGLVVGYVAAICMGKVDFSGFQNLAIVSVPQFMPFKPEFDWGSTTLPGLFYVVSSVEVLGDTAALTKVGLNRTPTERETAGAIAGDGSISTVSGLFGCSPLTSFAQNIGLVAMTKVVNRKVILSGGLILVLASFVPAIAEGVQPAAAGGARRLHDHDVRQHHSFGLPDDCRGGLHAAQHHDCGAFADHRHRLHPGERHLHAAVPGTVPTNLRLELHRRGVRGGRILNTVLPSEEHFLSAPKEAPAADAEDNNATYQLRIITMMMPYRLQDDRASLILGETTS